MIHASLHRSRGYVAFLLFTTSLGSFGCSSAPAEPGGPSDACNEGFAACDGDPEAGAFTLDEALSGLAEGPGPLRAIIDTDLGAVTCSLYPDKAPNGVANFAGLARGQRPAKDASSGAWVKRPFYDGLLFHRVIPEFMAQGGDPIGVGTGGPGYKLNDEISDLVHEPGSLAYANSGPNTNGSQFYIAERSQPGLDGGYTIFGLCAPVSVVTALTHVPRDASDRPSTDLHIKTVTITRSAP